MPSQNVCSAQREYCGQCVELEKIVEVKHRCRWNKCFMRTSDTCPCKPSHFNKADRPDIPGEIVYSSTPWKMYRQNAGMGEHDYAVFLNDVFFCRTEHSQTAHEIIRAMRPSTRPHWLDESLNEGDGVYRP